MTQFFNDKGEVVPATLVEAGPCSVVQIKTKEKEGYSAVQIGCFPKKRAKNKPAAGHLKDLENFSFLREYRVKDTKEIDGLGRGGKIEVDVFKEGDVIMVSGTTKAKGFQGVVKRHGFGGGRASHGQKHSLREAGSIGATWPQRVIKGKRMAGRMGGVRVSIKGLKIAKIDKENNLLVIKGAVPGRPGTLLEIIKK